MASWGYKDNLHLTGNVTAADDSDIVTGFDTEFLLEVMEGDYISIDGQKYQTDKVSSNTQLRLTSNCSTNSDNVSAYVQQGPKYISNVDIEENVYTIQRVYGIDLAESQVPENRDRNIKQPGWYHYNTFTGGHGQERHQAEVLVAFSKNYTSNVAGDADDDNVALDAFLYFTQQPDDQINVEANANVTFNVVAESFPEGVTIEYQWYESENNIVFTALTDDATYTGTDSNTLNIANVDGLDGYFYHVEIEADGAASNVSDSAIITHA